MKNSLLLDAVAKIPFLGEMSAMSTPLVKLQVYQSSPGGSNAFIRPRHRAMREGLQTGA